MALLSKIEFWNKGVTPSELMGILPDEEHPDPIGDKFEKGFADPPVGDDYYANMYALAEYTTGQRRKCSEDTQCVLKCTTKIAFDHPEDEYTDNPSPFPVNSKLDLSWITEFEIDPLCLHQYELQYKHSLDEDWISVILTPTFENNIFTALCSIELPMPNGWYEFRARWYDKTIRLNDETQAFYSDPQTSGWSAIKTVAKVM